MQQSRTWKKVRRIAVILGIAMTGFTAGLAQAGTTWTGGGGSASWGDANNWGGALPAFDGSETLTFGSGFTSGTTLDLDANRAMDTLDLTTTTDLTFQAGIAGSKMQLKNINVSQYQFIINNDITLTGNGTWDSNGPVSINLTVNGDIDDSGNGYGINFSGARYARINGNNTFTGALSTDSGRTYVYGTNTPSQTNISGSGYFYFNNGSAFGTGPINISGGGIIASGAQTLTNDVNFSGNVSIGLAGGNTIDFQTGTVTLVGNTSIAIGISGGSENVDFNNGIADDGGARSLTLTGNRSVIIRGASTYTGVTNFDGNSITLTGTMATSAVNLNGAGLIFAADNPIGSGLLTINSGNLSNSGARRTVSNDMVWAGDWLWRVNGSSLVDLTGDVTMTSDVTIDQRTGTTSQANAPYYKGDINDGGNGYKLTFVGSGSRYHVLEGKGTYSGGTTISDANGTVFVVVQGAADRLPATGPVQVIGGATLQFAGGFEQTIGHLTGDGTIISGGSNIVLADGTGSWAGNITGGGTLEVDGATQTITTGQSFSGGTTITSGTLITANGSGSATGSGPVTVNGGILTGTGSVSGQVTVNGGGTVAGNFTVDDNLIANAGGILAPGNSPGQLVITGDLTMNANSIYEAELDNNFAITGYDVLSVSGDVTLNDPILDVILGYEPAVSDVIFLIFNNGANAITGNFLGLPEGSIVDLGEFDGVPVMATISYFGDSNTSSITGGNDVVLYNFSIPEPTTMSLLSLAGLMVLRRRRGA